MIVATAKAPTSTQVASSKYLGTYLCCAPCEGGMDTKMPDSAHTMTPTLSVRLTWVPHAIEEATRTHSESRDDPATMPRMAVHLDAAQARHPV